MAFEIISAAISHFKLSIAHFGKSALKQKITQAAQPVLAVECTDCYCAHTTQSLLVREFTRTFIEGGLGGFSFKKVSQFDRARVVYEFSK
ncbi:MAG: hypothetical protein OSA51_00835 [Octadecabacter sp.]|nr:hypothetical protein [Octadecabacter sp.]